MTTVMNLATAFGGLALLCVAAAGCGTEEAPVPATSPSSQLSELQRMTDRFAPTDVGADISKLSSSDRQVLAKLVEASKTIDALFLRQVCAGSEAMLLDLVRDQTPAGRERLHYFLINKGPWSRLDRDEPFVAGTPPKPEGATSIPSARRKPISSAGSSRCRKSSARAQEDFSPSFGGELAARSRLCPTVFRYQNELAHAAGLLREAAALTSEPTLRTFLIRRADAFLSNDYYASDVAWLELQGAIEPTIGPYEVYEDEFFNYKAAFESFISIRDDAETAKIQRFSRELQDIEDHLPIDPRHRNLELAALAPLVVVNEIFAAGDANRGVQDRRLQPAERRAVAPREGRQASDAEKRSGREVRESARADFEDCPGRPRSIGRLV